jgi:hypothetical protein
MCPNCGSQFEVSTALAAQLRDQLQKEFQAEARRKDAALAVREDALAEREQVLEESRRSIDSEVTALLDREREQLRQEVKVKAYEAVSLELQDLSSQLADAKNERDQAKQAELQLRKERRSLEEEKRQLELTVTRKLDEERATIRETAKREADEEHRLQEAEKDKLVADLRRQIDGLKRKSEQGSQQAQGEILELETEDLLRDHFPLDTFEPVPVGVHGGDLLQHVHDSTGFLCGTILWEFKRTKSWNDGWLPKLRDDQRAARAHLAVLTTVEMPKGHTTFTCIDGVWVTSRSCVVGLATALRAGILELGRTKRSLEGKQTKVEFLYDYLSGPEFRQRIEGIVEAFITMKDDLESEKRSMQRLWAKRQKQLERAVLNTASMYGDLGGIMGSSLPQIANLELPAAEEESESLILEPAWPTGEESPF